LSSHSTSTPGLSLTKRVIQPRIIGSWSMMFHVRKLIFLGACAMAGAASVVATAPAPDFSSARLEIMISFLLWKGPSCRRPHASEEASFSVRSEKSTQWPQLVHSNRAPTLIGGGFRGKAHRNRSTSFLCRHKRFARPEALDRSLSLL